MFDRLGPFAVGLALAACPRAVHASTTPASAAVSAATSFADFAELDLEDLLNPVIVGASKFEQTQSRAPASVDVITRDEIVRYGYRSLADVLRGVRGMYVTEDRNYTFLGMRGISRSGDYNSRLLILVDGHRLNDNIWDAVLVGQDFPVDIDAVQRIEIIRGPASSLYGANAFLGIINVVTRRGGDYAGGEVGLEAGSQRMAKPAVAWGGELGDDVDVAFMVSGYWRHGHERLRFAEYADPASNNGVAENMDREQAWRGIGSVAWRGWRAFGGYAQRSKRNPTGNYGVIFNDKRYQTEDGRAFVELAYEHEFERVARLIVRSGWDSYDYEASFPYSYAVNRDVSRGEWWTSEARATWLMIPRNRLTVGVEHKRDYLQKYLNFDEEPRYWYSNIRTDTYALGGYLQDEVDVTSWLLLNAGVRLDHTERFGEAVNPRAGVILEPAAGTTLKVLYGQAYRIPDVYDEWDNAALDVERIRSLEANVEQRFLRHLRMSAGGYANTLRDMINEVVVADPDGVPDSGDEVYRTTNNERIDTLGGEVELRGAWDGGFEARLGYDVQRSRREPSGSPVGNSPGHIGRVNAVAPLFPGAGIPAGHQLFVAVAAQVLSPRRLPANPADKTNTTVAVNVNLLSHDLAPGLDLSLGVYNALDRDNEDPGRLSHAQRVIVLDGTTVRGKATWSF